MKDTNKTVGAKAAEPPETAETMEMTKLGENIGEAVASKPADAPEPAVDQEQAGLATPAEAQKAVKLQFKFKITQRTGLIAATLLLGLGMLLIFGRATGRNKATGEVRQERTVESLTPESLVAMCGQPAADATKDLYPMIKRTISYESSGKGTLTLEFSRTAEENSDWVFLSMSDGNGAAYGTPETQIAAMPCLKSRK
jgi:hypothetical protein